MNHIIIYISIILLLFHNVTMAQEMVNQKDEKGLKTGFWILSSNDGKTKIEEGKYKNGQKDGIWKAYYPDGKLKHQIEFKDGTARGKASFYYPDGTLWEDGTWNEYCWIGEYRLYYPNGETAYEWSYNNQGRREGVQKYYFENGTVKYKGEWSNGVIKSNIDVYDSTGVLVQTRIYNEGVFETSKTSDSLSPQNEISQPDKSFLPFKGTGYNTLYRLNGKVDQKGLFKDGTLINGEVYIYDNNDILRQIRIYENGKLIKVSPVTGNDN